MSGESAELRVETRDDGANAYWLEVEISAARVDACFAASYRMLARSARVRGFRPGKAPISVLRKLHGPAIAEEVERELIAETIAAAIDRSGLEPISRPRVESEPPVEGVPFRYRARVEVKPRLALCELRGLPARRPSAAVTDADVEKELEELRQRLAQLVEEPEGATAAPGSIVTLDFDGRIEGIAFEGGSGKEVTIEIGAGQLLAGFDEQLVGARAGEERTVRVRLPADFGKAELAGKEAEFQVRVTTLRRREVPALDDEFARDLGDFESLEQVRAKIRESLVARRERAAQEVARSSLLDALIERVPFEVPPGVVEERLQQRLHDAAHDLEHRGLARAMVDRQLARWEEEWRPRVEREIREEWLLEAVAKAEAIGADDAELAARFERMAAELKEDAARLRKAYEDAGALEAVRAQLVEDKAVEFLLAAANVETSDGA